MLNAIYGFVIVVLLICVASLSIKVKDLQNDPKWAIVFMDQERFVQICGKDAISCYLWNDMFDCKDRFKEAVYCYERQR